MQISAGRAGFQSFTPYRIPCAACLTGCSASRKVRIAEFVCANSGINADPPVGNWPVHIPWCGARFLFPQRQRDPHQKSVAQYVASESKLKKLQKKLGATRIPYFKAVITSSRIRDTSFSSKSVALRPEPDPGMTSNHDAPLFALSPCFSRHLTREIPTFPAHSSKQEVIQFRRQSAVANCCWGSTIESHRTAVHP